MDHNPDSGSMGLGGICVSNKLPGGADSAGPSSTLGGPLNYSQFGWCGWGQVSSDVRRKARCYLASTCPPSGR